MTNDEAIDLTGEIVAAYVSHNPVPAADLSVLINSVFVALTTIGRPVAVQEPTRLEPAVPIKKSVTDEYIICLDDGKAFRSLKRHLTSTLGMTPEAYKAKWGLPKDYPMVAPAYAKKRSALAKSLGLGRPRLNGEGKVSAVNGSVQ